MQQGDIVSIFERPNSKFTATFVGMKNIHSMVPYNGKIKIKEKNVIITPAHKPARNDTSMGIRPEDIALNINGSQDVQNCFQGKIKRVSSNGVFLSVYLQTENLLFEAIWPRSYLKDYGLDTGRTVSFGFHPESVHTF